MQFNFTLNISARSVFKYIKNLITTKNSIILILFILLCASILYAQQRIIKPFTFNSGDTIVADELNKNFDTLYEKIHELSDYDVSAIKEEVRKIEESLNNQIKILNHRVSIMENSFIPPGVIVMYSGNNTPLPGWEFCDGASKVEGVPDLSDKFIVAASTSTDGSYQVGDSEDDPEHDHDISHTHSGTATGGEHRHIWGKLQYEANSGYQWQTYLSNGLTDLAGWVDAQDSCGAGSELIPLARDISELGNDDFPEEYYTDSTGHSHNCNITGMDDKLSSKKPCLPSYYALAFIMKVDENEEAE